MSFLESFTSLIFLIVIGTFWCSRSPLCTTQQRLACIRTQACAQRNDEAWDELAERIAREPSRFN